MDLSIFPLHPSAPYLPNSLTDLPSSSHPANWMILPLKCSREETMSTGDAGWAGFLATSLGRSSIRGASSERYRKIQWGVLNYQQLILSPTYSWRKKITFPKTWHLLTASDKSMNWFLLISWTITEEEFCKQLRLQIACLPEIRFIHNCACSLETEGVFKTYFEQGKHFFRLFPA